MQPPQPAFKRLHLVYIVAYAIRWCMFHMPGSNNITDGYKVADYDDVNEEIDCRDYFSPKYFPKLVILAGCTGHPDAKTTHRRLGRLLKGLQNPDIPDLGQIDYDKEKTKRTGRDTGPYQLLDRAIMANDDSNATFEAIKAELNGEEAPEPQSSPNTADASATTVKQQIILPIRHSHPANPHAEWHQLPAANFHKMGRDHGFPLCSRALPPGGYLVPGGGKSSSPNYPFKHH